MNRHALLVAAAVAGALLVSTPAEARNVGPDRYSPGPAPPSLVRLVEAAGGSSADAAAPRFAYLRKLDSHAQALATARLTGASVAGAARREGATVSPQGVLVDVYVSDDVDVDSTAAALRDVGMRVQAVSRRPPQRMVEGWLPANALVKAAGRADVQAVSPVAGLRFNAGGTLSQGDGAHRGPPARALGPTGAAIKVGIVSDSINRVGAGVAGSQASGDLPAGVTVLQEGPPGSSDEGRAMAEIVYDTAPGVTNMYFSTGAGAATRAAGISNMVSQGVRVIADDTAQLSEPFFQDGVVAQAVDAAKAAGATYLVSAGNSARQSWEGTYAPMSDPRAVSSSTNDFDPGPGQDAVQSIGTFTNNTILVALQWDEPFGRATTNLAVDVYDVSGGIPVYSGTVDSDNVATGLPQELVAINVSGTVAVGIGLRRVAGVRNPFVKYLVVGAPTFTIAEYPTNSGAIDPDASSARGALTVAASNFSTPGTPEPFSSRGPARRLFDAAGNRLAAPDVRAKPDLAAADGVATSVPGFDPFFGTSAAAPSAAGVAALVRSAKPEMPASVAAAIMTNPGNAIDCTTAAGNPDADCGSGFILADRAVAQALDPTPPAVSPTLTPSAPNGPNGFYTGNVAVTWSVSDPDSPIGETTGCSPTTVSTDGVTTFACSAVSAGGTTTSPVTVRRDGSPPLVAAALKPARPNGKNGFYTGNVAVAWSVGDPHSPISRAVGCGQATIKADGVRTLTCGAVSATAATRSVTVKRDASRPAKPTFRGISSRRYKRSKLPKRSRIKCRSKDRTSGILSCRVRGYSRRLGVHRLTATATNRAGLTAKRTRRYTVVR